MRNLNELKQISDILDEREKDLIKREIVIVDKEKTLAIAFKEFKQLLNKIENYGK